MNHDPLVTRVSLKLAGPSPSDKRADAERLLDGLEKTGLKDAEIPLDVLRKLPSEFRAREFGIDLVIGLLPSGRKGSLRPKVLDISAGRIYGMAVDIGSTNIECSLFDLVGGGKIDSAGTENPQIAFGPDVLTRVQRSMMGEYAVMTERLLEGLNSLIGLICARNGIAPDEIFEVVFAGNTIMSHFLLGLDVNNIPLSPYIPVINGPVFARGEELGLSVHNNALVYVLPGSGSYVGGDIIGGIISAGVHKEEEPVLFIDVGTNVEVTLGCRDWIMVGAGAAGPALEGGVAAIGRKAEAGTISRVSIDASNGEVDMEVISGVEPSGICGSGLIDLVAELFSHKIIDGSGRFVGGSRGVVERSGSKAFLLYRSGEKELFLTEEEIRNFLLSKAAMFSFLYVFVRSVGLSFRDIKKVFVSGALGCGIDPEKAIRIGMLPDIPRERFVPLGNSSLRGAEMVLLDRGLLGEVEEVAEKITYREMNEDAELMSVLQGALFIPHTDPDVLKG